MITVDTTGATNITGVRDDVLQAYQTVLDGSGQGSQYLGWKDLPVSYDKDEYNRIKEAAKFIQGKADILIVIGIGGSYLGARAVIDALSDPLANLHEDLDGVRVVYAGNHIDGAYIKSLLRLVETKDVCINVISKSGTTIEPALAFRLLSAKMTQKYGKAESAKRIFATTDASKGVLKELATQKGYETFVVPDDVGGRYSVLTAVGLLPIAAAGIDIDELMSGAVQMRESIVKQGENHLVLDYVAARNALYREGKKIEIIISYDPTMHYFSEWWKQLFGESEGKEGKGLYPSSMNFSTDLHSLGQYAQEGERSIFETVLAFQSVSTDLEVSEDNDNHDGLNYLAGKKIFDVTTAALEGTRQAHLDGGVPQIILELPEKSAGTIGQMIYFFEFACAVSAYTLGVNPFDQPGVEAYKKNMFTLLGKPE